MPISRITLCIRLPLLCGILFLTACSTYKTNTDITFESIQIEQKPEVLVGGKEFESYRLDYLGWVDAKVSRPSVVHAKPTKEQADVVLAKLAKEKGAQGVFFVSYNWNLMGALHARGQAVRIHGIDQLATYKEKLQVKKAEESVEKLAEFTDENNANPAIFVDVKDDPLVEAYMLANPVEAQIAAAGPDMASLPQADLLATIEQLKAIQQLAFDNKNIVIYEAVSELLKNLKLYE